MISERTATHVRPPRPNGPVDDERDVGDLFTELAGQLGTLVRQEVKLVTTEMSAKAVYAGKQAALVAVGGALGVVSLLTFVAALVLALGIVLPLWASALIVGGAFATAACLIVWIGLSALKRMDAKPTLTLQTIKETKSWDEV